MLYPEQVSPNVTLINNSHIDYPFENTSVCRSNEIRNHGNGIFEIQIDPSIEWFYEGVVDQFEWYKNNGGVYPVSTSGLKDVDSGIGSERFCTMSSSLAQWLTDIIAGKSLVDYIKQPDTIESNAFGLEYTAKNEFEMLNVSQYFRFMRYMKGGEHFPHYDSDFVYDRIGGEVCTKYSLVMYFTDCDSGEFAFVNDTRGETTDWNRQATEDEIYLKIKPRRNKILLFPHTLCHTVLPFTDVDNERVIVRGDILFKKV